ncbi:hypothetical protein MBAV_006022 [Candidatus Magnetobacterium bavaricum]|uniref:Uncharacterized protein n=1 Tax=Candidatus Magnetobacterium bavaricum TaxID=29290 RepID=A0A0F3GIN9_9BACT|nr:hypothetical protein MBAV_006022 [Candidatus Magnetobacterium bavaricum]
MDGGMINQWLQGKRKPINYDDVISSVYREVEPSAGYFLHLIVANLNFVAIIISTCWIFFFYGFRPALISKVLKVPTVRVAVASSQNRITITHNEKQ